MNGDVDGVKVRVGFLEMFIKSVSGRTEHFV